MGRSGARRERGEARRKAVSPAREAAFRVLDGVERRRGEPAGLLSAAAGSLGQPDRDLATEIVYGVLRWRARLDHVLTHHSRRELRTLHPTVVLALRIGLYQIAHLSRVPKRAAVDESVRLARAFGAARASGYVNAVLRNVLRQPDAPPLPTAENPLDFLAITLSHPRWLAQRYLARLGLERAAALCRVQNEPPPTYFRISRRLDFEEARAHLAGEGIEAEAVPPVPRCLRALRGRIQDSTLFEQGAIFVQDAGSQLVASLLAATPGETVLDVCAAPGGKALATCERVRPRGRVLAVEKRAARARLMASLGARAGATELAPIVGDGRALPLRGPFRKILLDAPCTSLGTLRRNPDVKWRVRESDLARMAALQLDLLRAASRELVPGGRLVYATCSSEPEENEEVVARALAESAGLRRLHAASGLPEAARHLVDADGAFRTSPERDDMDAYYAVLLTRENG